MKTITRRLEIDAGHRLKGHESKCRNVHGHRYVFLITVGAEHLDDVGRVIDFGLVKKLCGDWLDDNWDHGFIYQLGDDVGALIASQDSKTYMMKQPPTAENMSTLFHEVATELLRPHGVRVVNVRLFETPNCYADSRGIVRWQEGDGVVGE